MGFSSAEQFINVRIHLSSASRKGVFVPVGQHVRPIFCDPALGETLFRRWEGWEWALIRALPLDAMALWPQDVHAMAEGSLSEESLFVLLMSDVLFHDILFHTLCLLDVSPAGLKDWVHLRVQTDKFGDGAPCTLVLHLPQHFFVGNAV